MQGPQRLARQLEELLVVGLQRLPRDGGEGRLQLLVEGRQVVLRGLQLRLDPGARRFSRGDLLAHAHRFLERRVQLPLDRGPRLLLRGGARLVLAIHARDLRVGCAQLLFAQPRELAGLLVAQAEKVGAELQRLLLAPGETHLRLAPRRLRGGEEIEDCGERCDEHGEDGGHAVPSCRATLAGGSDTGGSSRWISSVNRSPQKPRSQAWMSGVGSAKRA